MFLLMLLLQSILSQGCPPEPPSGGDPPLLPSVDFPGGDIEKIPTPDVTSCQLMCTNHPRCTAFSYYSIDPKTGERSFDCHIKASETQTSQSVPGVTSGYPLPRTPQNVNRCLAQYYDDVEFVGNVLSFGFVSSREECEASCTRNPGCQFYTFYPPMSQADASLQQRCYLQYSTSLPSPPNITVVDGAESGFSQRACCTGSQCLTGCADLIFHNTTFGGTIIDKVKSFDVLLCQQTCTQNPLCQFFTYSLHEDLWCECYLKNSESGLPENVTSVPLMYSGFAKQPTEPGFLGCADLLVQDSEYEGTIVMDAEVESVEKCQQMCTSHALCDFFTLLPGESTTAYGMSICQLKNSATNTPTMVTPRQDAVSGFSMEFNIVQKNIKNCSDLLYPSLEFSGVEDALIVVPDVESCRTACTDDLNCSFFTAFWNQTGDRLTCHLRTSVSGIPTSISPAGNATSGFSLDAGGSLDCSALFLPDTIFSGSVIGYFMSPDEYHCQHLCSQNPTCVFFTHFNEDWSLDERRFHCFLQSGDQGMPSNILHLPNTTSGFSRPLSGLNKECMLEEYDGLDFPGTDMRSLKMPSFADCQWTCTQDPLCQYFTFFSQTNLLPDQTDTCYLKSLLAIPLPQMIRSSPGVVSGFPQRNCEGHTSDSPPDVLPSC